MAYIRRESDVNNRPFTECGYKYRVSVRLVSVRALERKCSSSCVRPASDRSAQSAGIASNISSSHNMSIMDVLYLYEISKRNTVYTISYINTVNCYYNVIIPVIMYQRRDYS